MGPSGVEWSHLLERHQAQTCELTAKLHTVMQHAVLPFYAVNNIRDKLVASLLPAQAWCDPPVLCCAGTRCWCWPASLPCRRVHPACCMHGPGGSTRPSMRASCGLSRGHKDEKACPWTNGGLAMLSFFGRVLCAQPLRGWPARHCPQSNAPASMQQCTGVCSFHESRGESTLSHACTMCLSATKQ